MDMLRDYVIRLIATVLLCAVILRFARGSSAIKTVLQLLCGIVIAYCVIQPAKQLKIPELSDITTGLLEEADYTVQMGKEAAANALAAGIDEGIEAYILQKAKALNLNLTVSVELSDDEIPAPIAVTLTGNASPYAKTILCNTIAQDLNIPKERQTWISN